MTSHTNLIHASHYISFKLWSAITILLLLNGILAVNEIQHVKVKVLIVYFITVITISFIELL